MTAMPVLICVLCIMAIAYRYYSAFIAAKIAVLDDSRETPAVRLNDGQNYHPTNKWVLFGHHFAAISGAGPLIGPVLAAQFGYLPGLIWIVIGVCIGGAVQDFLVLVASMRRNGRSLAQIAFDDVGRVAGTAAMTAILFIIVIALAGLGIVVVKALGGEEVKYPADSILVINYGKHVLPKRGADGAYEIPAQTVLVYNKYQSQMTFNESFRLKTLNADVLVPSVYWTGGWAMPIPKGSYREVPGSAWGTFTIACTIPIALFVGLYMYKIRKGRVLEASLIGGALTIGATILGGYVAQTHWGQVFNLPGKEVTWAIAFYGFVASVLPVWVLLCPRDYLSSFLKIGTIALLVIGTILANPRLEAAAMNTPFFGGGPVVVGKIFPFLFITIMCGAISGFHALVSSGTTPKMIARESHARTIGYGAMLIEGLVGVVAMIAAATLPVGDYYAMNTKLQDVPAFQERFAQIGARVDHLNIYEDQTRESLRGRVGGAVTLAVGFAHIFDVALGRFSQGAKVLWKYWYHFAIMFEALFILTTIDTGTRIGRFLVQELFGKIHPRLGRTDWWPGAIVSTALVVAGWAYFIRMNADSFNVIWGMFGVANQMLAVIALAIVSVVLFNEGKTRYLWVTIVPLVIVMTTTSTAALQLLMKNVNDFQVQWSKATGSKQIMINSVIQGGLILVMLVSTIIVIIAGASRILLSRSRAQDPNVTRRLGVIR